MAAHTVVFLHWCLICAVLLHEKNKTAKFGSMTFLTPFLDPNNKKTVGEMPRP